MPPEAARCTPETATIGERGSGTPADAPGVLAVPASEATAFDAYVFDVYGTLLDVHSAMARMAPRLGPEWEAMSRDWRAKQIEYSWVRSLAGPAHHRDFAQLTDAALEWVAARHSLADPELIADLRRAWRALDPYPEVPALLRGLRARGARRAALSNGAPETLEEGLRAAGIRHLLDAVLSVESVGVFKPDPRVYQLAPDRFATTPDRIAFFSSNAWDAFGAACAGFAVHWVNRAGLPDEYGLRGRVVELADLSTVVAPARAGAVGA